VRPLTIESSDPDQPHRLSAESQRQDWHGNRSYWSTTRPGCSDIPRSTPLPHITGQAAEAKPTLVTHTPHGPTQSRCPIRRMSLTRSPGARPGHGDGVRDVHRRGAPQMSRLEYVHLPGRSLIPPTGPAGGKVPDGRYQKTYGPRRTGEETPRAVCAPQQHRNPVECSRDVTSPQAVVPPW